jgi:serine/threonine-protein kinase
MSDPVILNNRYQLEAQIGSGGMATIFKARDLMLERNVAIKILRKDFSQIPAFGERFRQEAKAAANLSHPNIVTVHDFGFDGGHLFIVLEYIPGITLKTLISQRGRLTKEKAIPLLVQACAGIGYAHRAGLVHCDVKPQNILVTPDQRVKVTDFGIARALASIQSDEQSDIVWGSPQYFSPEQAAGKAPSPASDVYSLGVVLFEMLTGQLPFISSSSTELTRLHREAQPPSPRALNPAINEDLNRIILKVLSKEPSSRYRTADQLGRVLITFSQNTVPDRVRSPAFQPREVHQPQPIIERKPPRYVSSPKQQAPKPEPSKAEKTFRDPLDLDWLTIILGLIALMSVGGLIPFWLWVYFSLNQ